MAGPHNLRGFIANSTQHYFLIVRILSFFCEIRDKSAIFNILRQNVTVLDTRSCAALRAADLDWIVGPEYSLGGYIFGDSQLLRRRSL